MNTVTRARYAPSPTGLQHIGGLRTALFNRLFAHSSGGVFILRLEDTDRTRFDQSFVQNLYDTFQWLNLKWDEGPYIQSERTGIYREYAEKLLASGHAYRCFCTSERLEALRAEREASHSPQTGYDRHCRALPPGEAEKRAALGEKFVVRLKIPLNCEGEASTTFHDHLLGSVTWKNADISPDPVLLKSDGFPTYHLANVVDDHLMGITHVLRAQEWLSSTPLHVIMYGAFGWTPPEFCHLPMVMGSDGKKLSKRHGATSINEFRDRGVLPEALLNYVARLGCSYEEGQEIYSLDELEKEFSLDRLNAAPAIFDYKKLEWYNGQYIRAKTSSELAALALPFALKAGLFAETDNPSIALFEKAIALVRERALYLTEIPEKLLYLFKEPPAPPVSELIPKKTDSATAKCLLEAGLEMLPLLLKPVSNADTAACQDAALQAAAFETECQRISAETAEKLGCKTGDLLMPLRVAVTGSRVSPPLFESLRLLGLEKCTERVKKALARVTLNNAFEQAETAEAGFQPDIPRNTFRSFRIQC